MTVVSMSMLMNTSENNIYLYILNKTALIDIKKIMKNKNHAGPTPSGRQFSRKNLTHLNLFNTQINNKQYFHKPQIILFTGAPGGNKITFISFCSTRTNRTASN